MTDGIAFSHSERIAPIDTGNNVDPVNVDPVPSDLPEDTIYLGDRLDKVVALLASIEQGQVRNEVPSPGMYFLQSLHNDFPQNVRLRVRELVIGSSAAGNVTLQVGTASVLRVDFPGADTKVIPLPITIDAGKDVTLLAGGGAAITAGFVNAYPESERP